MRFMSATAAPPRKVALNVESAARQAVIFRLARALVRLARDRLNAKKISAARHTVIGIFSINICNQSVNRVSDADWIPPSLSLSFLRQTAPCAAAAELWLTQLRCLSAR